MSFAALTFDIDWAPDWAIRECRDLCQRHGIPATFYVTHASDEISALGGSAAFELGIHPNFLPGSSQGGTEREVLDFCLNLVPGARSMRCHALVQSSRLFDMVADDYPMIDSDSSIFLPGHPGLQPTAIALGGSRRRLIRLPYYWCDLTCGRSPDWDWGMRPPASDGLRIFDVHPALYALNLAEAGQYERLKDALGGKPLNLATWDDFSPFFNDGPGEKNYLENAIVEIGAGNFRTVSQITDSFVNGGL